MPTPAAAAARSTAMPATDVVPAVVAPAAATAVPAALAAAALSTLVGARTAIGLPMSRLVSPTPIHRHPCPQYRLRLSRLRQTLDAPAAVRAACIVRRAAITALLWALRPAERHHPRLRFLRRLALAPVRPLLLGLTRLLPPGCPMWLLPEPRALLLRPPSWSLLKKGPLQPLLQGRCSHRSRACTSRCRRDTGPWRRRVWCLWRRRPRLRPAPGPPKTCSTTQVTRSSVL